MSDKQVAAIVGVGPGLGFALVRRFARAGMAVALAARTKERLEQLLAGEPVEHAKVYACDATDKAAVDRLFTAGRAGPRRARGRGVQRRGLPSRAAFSRSTPPTFERCWRIGCFAGFLVGQAAAGRMVAQGRGTIIFTGATAALRGSARFANLAVPKFGLRALAQSMARELGPKGSTSATWSSTARSCQSAMPTWRAGRGPDFAPAARCDRRDVLPAARAAAQRLDPRARPAPLVREVLASTR